MSDSKIIFCGNSKDFLAEELTKASNAENGGTAFRIPSLVNADAQLLHQTVMLLFLQHSSRNQRVFTIKKYLSLKRLLMQTSMAKTVSLFMTETANSIMSLMMVLLLIRQNQRQITPLRASASFIRAVNMLATFTSTAKWASRRTKTAKQHLVRRLKHQREAMFICSNQAIRAQHGASL